MNKKTILELVILLPTILSMLFYWFGDKANVIAVSGKVILFNPITITCIIIYLIGTCTNNKRKNKICIFSLVGITLIEFYTIFTWYIYTITGTFNIKFAISNIKIWGIIGPLISIITIILYIIIQKKFKSGENH